MVEALTSPDPAAAVADCYARFVESSGTGSNDALVGPALA